jgi:membrane-associated phospholipid phosphatase
MNRSHRYKGNEAAMPWQTHAVPGRSNVHAPALDLRQSGVFVAFRREFAAAWAACSAFEWVALGYLGLSSALIVIFAENLAHPVRLLGVQAFVAAVILALCGTQARVGIRESLSPSTTQKFWHFWRHWYPHLFFLFCFEELGHLVHLVSPGWRDVKLIAFDYWLTGVHPAIWLEQFATPARNDFMQFAYITYFTYLLALGGILYYRKDWRAYWSVMTYSAVGYAIGYMIAIFFPIESPWFSMAGSWHAELRGGPFTALINFIEHYGRVRGAAFPSEHVAGSFAALWGAWRHRRWLFWVMLPLVLCMCVSTVYGRYHYVADIFAGMVTGTLGYCIGGWLMKKTAPSSTPLWSAGARSCFCAVNRTSTPASAALRTALRTNATPLPKKSSPDGANSQSSRCSR